MRILFLTHYFPPEVNAPAVRTYEHCKRWVEAGHRVQVVTCFPSHPNGVVFPGYVLKWHQREEVDGIDVHRVWTFIAPNRGSFRRILNYVSFVPSAAWRALRSPRPDVIVATSPQFFVALAGWTAAALRRVPWVFEVRDLWPESIVAVGAMKPSLTIRMLERIELKCYRSAARVVLVTRSFIGNLVGRGVPREKLVFVPNGVDVDFWRGGDRVGFRRSLGIGGNTFVASYVGTVGMAHGIGVVLNAARRLRDASGRYCFLVVGDGAERESLESRARAEGLSNVVFTGLLPRERMPDVLAASDACLVLLRRSELFKTVLPSKMFEAMAAARPIILGVEGEARRLLEEARAGVAIPPEDPEALVNVVSELAAQPGRSRALGVSGRRFVEREFTRDFWAGKMLSTLTGIVEGSRRDGCRAGAGEKTQGERVEGQRR